MNNVVPVGQANSTYAPFVTIITSTLNCRESLKKTILSIQQQTYKKIQWIVVDGASNDGTVDLIKDNTKSIANWLSESDNGIYDAWNKACNHIHGDWVLFLGAGDIFSESRTLELVVRQLSNLSDDVVIAYGNVVQKSNGKEIYRYGQVDLNGWETYRPKLPAHQGVFQKSSLFEGAKFDASYRVVADSKFMLETLKKGLALYFDIDVCIMEPGGVSSSPKYALRVMDEFFRLEKDLGYQIPLVKKTVYLIKSHVKTSVAAIIEKLRI